MMVKIALASLIDFGSGGPGSVSRKDSAVNIDQQRLTCFSGVKGKILQCEFDNTRWPLAANDEKTARLAEPFFKNGIGKNRRELMKRAVEVEIE